MSIVSWWQAGVLGLVEGITEYLPISSTGHLIIASGLMGLDDPQVKGSVDAFNIVIQGGAILAVLGLYRARVMQMLRGLLGRDPSGLRLFLLLLVSFAPAAVLAPRLDDWLERLLFHPGPVLAALALGGIYMIVLDRWRIAPARRAERLLPDADGGGGADDLSRLGFRSALIIGLFQTIAMVPGTSRSMMTITAGVLVGLRPRAAAEYSFLLGLPTLGGACVYKAVDDIRESSAAGVPNMFEQLGWLPIVVGMLVATVSAAVAVRWLVSFLNRHGLAPFGYYRLALAAVMGGLMLAGVVRFAGAGEAAEGAEDAGASPAQADPAGSNPAPAGPAEGAPHDAADSAADSAADTAASDATGVEATSGG